VLHDQREDTLKLEHMYGAGLNAVNEWLHGKAIDFSNDAWGMYNDPVIWMALSRFLVRYQVARLLNELSDALRQKLSSSMDAELWITVEPSDQMAAANIIVEWLVERFEDQSPLEALVMDHVAYHMARSTPAGRLSGTSRRYRSLLAANHKLCSKLTLLQFSNNGAGPDHPARRLNTMLLERRSLARTISERS
jgi:hypothetical protein